MLTRSNQEWLDQLRGDCGEVQQAQAFDALATYLHHKAYDYLKRRQAQNNPWRLANLADEEVVALAQDAAQETLEKLARDEFALLASFRGEGAFTNWMKTIVIREVGQELRGPYWNRGVWWSLSEDEDQIADKLQRMLADDTWSIDPEKRVMHKEMIAALEKCQSRLSPELRQIFLGRQMDKRPAKELAATFRLPSVKDVYRLKRQANRDLERSLKESGWDRGLFDIFN